MHRGEKKNVLFYVIYDVRFDRSNELMFECSRNATKSKPSLGRHNWLYANDSIENQNQQRALSFAKCGCYWEQRVSGGDTGFVVLCNASSLMTCKVFIVDILCDNSLKMSKFWGMFRERFWARLDRLKINVLPRVWPSTIATSKNL